MRWADQINVNISDLSEFLDNGESVIIEGHKHVSIYKLS